MRYIRFLLLYPVLMCLVISPLFPQSRSFDEIFPNIPVPVRNAVFSSEGYSYSFENISPSSLTGSTPNSIDPQIIETLFRRQPGFIVESIIVIPGTHTLLDVYSALGKTASLAGRLYRSHRRNDYIPLFEEVTRIESASRRNTAIPDPPPASVIPPSETVFLRLKDTNFGNSFYRGEMNLSRHGLRYSLTNFRNLTYGPVRAIREERFTAQLYFEPIAEGMLVYGIAGVDVSDFVSSRIHMPSAIGKRLEVITSWVIDGITQ